MGATSWTEEEVIAHIVTTAAEVGIPIASLTRNRYRTEPGAATSKVFARFGGWRQLHALACGDSTPLPIIPPDHYVKGVSSLVKEDGTIKRQWVKTDKEKESRELLLKRLLTDLPEEITVRPGTIPKPTQQLSDDLLAVYPLGDPHIGMLAWAEECGDDFDLKLAKRLMQSAIDELVTHEPRAANALICNLGDFFHSDSQANKTARSGHPLDVDGRWAKVLRVGLDIMVYMIDRALTAHENVRVINEIGNHDDHSAIFLSVSLDAYYQNEPRVTIDMSPARFHYHVFGANLIGVTHGDGAKINQLESLMAADRAQDWGRTRHRFWYTGHIHHKTVTEERGCVIESFRTLSPKDAYATNAGYRSGRDMNRIILHQRFGEIQRSMVNAAYIHAQWADAIADAA